MSKAIIEESRSSRVLGLDQRGSEL